MPAGLMQRCHICVFVQKEAALRSVDMARAENITICTEVQFVACFLCKHSPLSGCPVAIPSREISFALQKEAALQRVKDLIMVTEHMRHEVQTSKRF